MPLHTVIKLTTLAYGCAEERINFGIDAVNTYVPRPQVSFIMRHILNYISFPYLSTVSCKAVTTSGLIWLLNCLNENNFYALSVHKHFQNDFDEFTQD